MDVILRDDIPLKQVISATPGARPRNCSISSPSASCVDVTVDFSMIMMKTAWLRLDSSFILVVPVALCIAPLSSRP